MDKLLVQTELPLGVAEHTNWMQDAPRKSIAGLLSNLTAINPYFYISGCGIVQTPIGSLIQYEMEAGFVCYKGEVLPVEAQTITRGLLQLIYLVIEETGVDLVPSQDLTGNQFEVMRKRVAKMQVTNVYPMEYMPINAPTQAELFLSTISGRIILPGSIIPYWGVLDEFDNTGLGQNGRSGWAICNGNNGTPDLRGMTLIGATNVPDATAPALYPGVTTTTNVGDKVGADAIVLDANQLPEHTHDYADEKVGGLGSDVQTGPSYPREDQIRTTEPNATDNNPVSVMQSSYALVFIMAQV